MTLKNTKKQQASSQKRSKEPDITYPQISQLAPSAEKEVLDFLSRRPIHTFGMTGLIQERGLINDPQQGTYFGCRDEAGALEGVALIGHFTLFETLSDRALQAFASVAQHNKEIHMMLGEKEKINQFLGFLNHQKSTQAFQYLQLEIKNLGKAEACNKVIRLAKPDDLSQIVAAHAQVLFQERGVDRLKVDPESFKKNCLNRILQGKTFVIEEKGKIIFKVEISTDTPEVVYLEGVWVHQEERGLGYGYRCLSQLIKNLLHRTTSVCLLLGEKNKAALNLYTKIGFQQRGYYQAVFT